MSEYGSFELGNVSEAQAGAKEGLSEEALQRLKANAAAIQAIRVEEKKSKQKDSAVANVLLQFLQDARYNHLFTLIAKLVSRNCPSIFILSIIALIHEPAKAEVQQYLAAEYSSKDMSEISLKTASAEQTDPVKIAILPWITDMQMVLAIHSEQILRSLLVDSKNIDGALLQLTIFCLQEHYKRFSRAANYNDIQPIALQLLHTVLIPYLAVLQKS
jgi:hypothetical protein